MIDEHWHRRQWTAFLTLAVERYRTGGSAASAAAAALMIAPDCGEAAFLLGVARGMEGDPAEAARWTRRAVILGIQAAVPALASALVNLGAARISGDRNAPRKAAIGAEAPLVAVAALDPGLVAAWNNLSVVRYAARRFPEAERMAARTAVIDAGHSEAHWNAGRAAAADGRARDALRHLRRAVTAGPGRAEFLIELGSVLCILNETAAARMTFRRALLLVPDAPGAFHGLAAVEERERADGRAEACLRQALALAPAYPAAIAALAWLWRKRRDLDGCLPLYQRMTGLLPDEGSTLNNLSLVWKDIGRLDLALPLARAAVEADPGNADFHRNLLATLLYVPDLDETARFAEHRRYEALHACPLYTGHCPHANPPDPDRRLAVAYLSSDLRSHSVARNLQPLIAAHDRDRFAVHLYAQGYETDVTTERLRAMADGWRNVTEPDDGAVARLMRDDGIDILVTVAGRFDRNRPLVAAHRPAPVQISLYDGATSGLVVNDALFTDRVMTPRHGTELFTERPIRLPTLFTYEPIADAPPIDPRPPMLRTGVATFGSFNNPSKLNDAVLDLWARLLAMVPGSRLTLKFMGSYSSILLRNRIEAAFAVRGVTADRLLMRADTPSQREHLALYADIDIALDPFPFCGATTTFEALWMGVPVVALPGANMMSRWSASLLSAVGLPELAAASPEEYLELAAGLAVDPARLERLRAGLAGRLAASPVCDGTRKVRHVERAYRALWRRWCRAAGRPS